MAEHELNAVAFARLSESQLAALGPCPRSMLNKFRADRATIQIANETISVCLPRGWQCAEAQAAAAAPGFLTRRR